MPTRRTCSCPTRNSGLRAPTRSIATNQKAAAPTRIFLVNGRMRIRACRCWSKPKRSTPSCSKAARRGSEQKAECKPWARLWPSGLVDEAMVDGVESELEAIGDAELVENIVQVVFHRLFADEKLLADFAVAEALRDELNDFLFAVAEERLFAALSGFR